MTLSSDPARQAAHAALTDILGKKVPLETALPPRLEALADPRDRSFAHQLVMTALRHRGILQQAVASLMDKPLPAKAVPVQSLLEMGLAQLLLLDVPDHAAVDSSVALTGPLRLPRHRALVNAVLRRAQRERPRLTAILEEPLAALPGWLTDRWIARFGAETAADIARALRREPPLDISVDADPASWAAALDGTVLNGNTIRRAAAPVAGIAGFDEGRWWVQDVAAALPARLLPVPDDGVVLDLCAAPGGKTAQLAAAGARVVAVDRSPRRLRRLRDNLRRLNREATVVEADAAVWRHGVPVGAILLDAPCSATGTLRRRPDIPWTKSAADIATLARLQAAILDNAVTQLRPGGILVYAVCSLEAEEGPDQIERILRETGVQRLPITAAEVGIAAGGLTPDGDLQTLPCHLADLGGMDGFYIARLRRPE